MKTFISTLRLTALVLALSTVTAAQPERQAANWHFGFGQSVSFVGGAPVNNPPSSMEGFEGVVSMSDEDGQLLFYTNGGGRPTDPNLPPELTQSPGIIWNRNHEVMYDMRGEEGGGFSARQSCIAFPDPSGEAGVYYLFTMDEAEFDVGGAVAGQPLGRGLSYFLIDMNLNGGLGGVRLADQRVYVPAYEGLDATPLADGSGYWVLTHNNTDVVGEGRFALVSVTAAGVSAVTEIPVGSPTGRLKFSPDGRYLTMDKRLYDFDPATGSLGETPRELPEISSQAVSFTPDSRFLYTFQSFPPLGEVIVRYDVTTLELIQVEPIRRPDALSTLAFGNLQLGPNGNLYFLETSFLTNGESRYSLSEISCLSNLTPSVTRDVVVFDEPGENLAQSLPSYVDAIFRDLVIEDTTRLAVLPVIACPTSGEGVVLTARETGSAYLWSTGTTRESIQVLEPGTYCVTITTDCGVTVDCQEVVFRGQDVTIELVDLAEAECGEVEYRYRIISSDTVTRLRYVIQDETTGGQVFSDGVDDPGEFFVPAPPAGANYVLRGLATVAGCSREITVVQPLEPYVDERFRPAFAAEPSAGDRCVNQPFTVTVENTGITAIAEVIGPDGSSGNPLTVTVTEPGPFPVQVVSACGDTTELTFDQPIAEFCECEGRVPELITPNGDGTNEVFRLFSTIGCPVLDYNLTIFNRWGQPVYQSSDPAQAWDGTANGTPQNTDTYLYLMTYRFPEDGAVRRAEGQFNLIR